MPLTTDQRNTFCRSIINQYLFDNVWNEPFSEYRVNIHPQKIRATSIAGSFKVLNKTIRLPTEIESYFIWYMNYSDLNLGLELTPHQWYSTDELCNEWRTTFNAYTLKGKVVPKHAVYLTYNNDKTVIYIVIKKDAFKQVDSLEALDNLYITVYHDSDKPNDTTILSFKARDSLSANMYQRQVDALVATADNSAQIQYFVNGAEYSGESIDVTVGDFFDVIIDKNIIFGFDIDLGELHEDPVFLSTEDLVWKQLIHIPRELNPDNKVITHNTCDFYIRNMDEPIPTGRYVHRITYNRTISQVTHNDMAIPLFIIDAYRDYLGTQNVGIHVVVRQHDKNNHLIRTANYVDLLYTPQHTDEDIIQILTGHGPTNITWWRAAELEKSAYTKMMFDAPNWHPSVDNLASYVDALGYYQVVNLLCKRIVTATITDSFKNSRALSFKIPLAFLGVQVIPIVYAEGKMIDTSFYNYECLLDSNICKITFNSNLVLNTGTTLAVLFNATTNNTIYEFTLDVDAYSIDIPYENPLVYLVHKNALNTKGVSIDSNISYEYCPPGSNVYIIHPNNDGTYKVTFNNAFIDDTFIIENSVAAYGKQYNLNSMVSTGENVVVNLTALPVDSENSVPIFGCDHLSVYLNGVYLVEGIDYGISHVVDNDGYVVGNELIIQTMDHFNFENDTVTVYYATSTVEDRSKGFVIDDKLYDETPVNLYFENLSTVHVDGKLVTDSTYYGTYSVVPENTYPQGSIWEIKTAIPRLIKELLSSFDSSVDREKIEIMNDYFYRVRPADPPIIVLNDKHRIYSVFVNRFIHDFLNGVVEIIDDPDVRRMSEAITPYLRLKETDLCYGKNDQRFIDYYPQYYNYDVDPHLKSVIDAFIGMYMPENVDPTNKVVY